MTDATVPCPVPWCGKPMQRVTLRECDAAGTSYEMPGWRCACGAETVEGRRR